MPLFILCPFVDVMHFLCSLYVSVVVLCLLIVCLIDFHKRKKRNSQLKQMLWPRGP